MIRGDRIKARLEAVQRSQADLAREIKVSPQAISKMVLGETTDSPKLYQIARFLQTTPEYLTGETENPDLAIGGSSAADDRPTPALRPDDVEISHIDLRFGLGGTYLDLPIEERKLIFPRSWLRQFTDAAPEHLCWAAGQGDSMLPTINHGEPILIDLGDKVPRMADMIWAVAYGEIGMVKRLRPLPDGSIELLSDNPNVPSARAVDGELHIIGRVVAVVKRL